MTEERELAESLENIVTSLADYPIETEALNLVTECAEILLQVMVRESCMEAANRDVAEVDYDDIAEVMQSRPYFEPMAKTFPRRLTMGQVKTRRKRMFNQRWKQDSQRAAAKKAQEEDRAGKAGGKKKVSVGKVKRKRVGKKTKRDSQSASTQATPRKTHINSSEPNNSHLNQFTSSHFPQAFVSEPVMSSPNKGRKRRTSLTTTTPSDLPHNSMERSGFSKRKTKIHDYKQMIDGIQGI